MEKEIKKDYESISLYLKFTIDLRNRLYDKVREELKELTSYVTSLMSIFGIVAGFGFTAFQYIKSPHLFFIGLILVIISILYLVFQTKRYLVGSPIDTEKHINDLAKKANEIKRAMKEGDELEIKRLALELKDRYDDESPSPKLMQAEYISKHLSVALYLSTPEIGRASCRERV